MSKKNEFLSEFKRLTGDAFNWLYEMPTPDNVGMPPAGQAAGATTPTPSPTGGQADLTPMKNKGVEAQEAIKDAIKAAEEGNMDDAKQAFQRAKAAIDQALGGVITPAGMGRKA